MKKALLITVGLFSACSENPTPPKADKLSPENARSALVSLLEKMEDEPIVPGGAGLQLEKLLRSEKTKRELKTAKIIAEGDKCYIGVWTCNLNTGVFTVPIELNGAHVYIVEGRFEMNPAKEWKATISGYDHLNTGK
jgi:hypothetical protein